MRKQKFKNDYMMADCQVCGERWYAIQPRHWVNWNNDEKVCSCGGQMLLLDKQSDAMGVPWPENGLVLEHAASQPVTLKSRRDAVKFAKEKKMELGCLL